MAFFVLLWWQEFCKLLIHKEGTRSSNGKRALSNGNSHLFLRSLPGERAAHLVFGNPGFEEVFLLAQVHDFAHPRERVVHAFELFRQAQLGETTVGDELQVLFHHGGVHAEYAAWHGVAGVLDFQLGAFQDHLGGLVAHLLVPQVRVFQFDLVDYVHTEVHVHGFVTQDVLELLGHASHFVATAHGEDLGEAAVEEDAFQYAVERDQVFQQGLVGFHGAGFEFRVGQVAGVLDAPLRFFGDGGDLLVHVEDFAFVHAQ